MAFSRRLALLFITAGASAISSHLAIDLLGDVVLPHDTYDDVAHDSRGVALAMTCLAAIAACVWALYEALHRPDRPAVRPRKAFEAHRFVIASVILAACALVGMESIDVIRSGLTIDGLSDLLGGDWRLGCGTLLAIAGPLAFVVWKVANALAAIPQSLVARVIRIARSLRRTLAPALHLHERRRRRRPTFNRFLLVSSLLGRAPPTATA